MEVRLVTVDDLREIAQVLVRAFYDDPVSSFLFPSSKRRPRALTRFFTIELSALYVPHGAVWTTDARDGVAVWAPPGQHRPGWRDLYKMIPMAPHILRHPARVARALGSLEAKHPREPHYYLATLGTDPPRQGKGVGTALMAPALEICDREGLPAYLESSKEQNVALYARHGFEVTEKFHLPLGGPPVWLMWRDPQGPS